MSFFKPTQSLSLHRLQMSGIILAPKETRRVHSHFSPARQYLTLRQSYLSDHAPFIVPMALVRETNQLPYFVPWNQETKHLEKHSILSWNMMGQGRYNDKKDRYNNAYFLDESNEAYRARIELVVKHIGECISRHPEISILSLQEAPIPVLDKVSGESDFQFEDCLNQAFKTYLPSHFRLVHDSTDWGIVTGINANRFSDAFQKQNTVYTGALRDMNVRKTTIQIPGCQTLLTNLHLPHDNPSEAVNQIADFICKNISYQIQHGQARASQMLIGDWNFSARDVYQHVEKKLLEVFHYEIPIKITITVTDSPNGHLEHTPSGVPKETHADSGFMLNYKLHDHDLDKAKLYLALHSVNDEDRCTKVLSMACC